MKLEKILKNKKVLFIPIISMRSYKNNKYNLFSDGNINRVLYKIKKSNCDATLTIPKNYDEKSYIELLNFIKRLKLNVKIIISDFYGKNALETRLKREQNLNIDFNNFDYVVIEPNYLCYDLINNNKIDLKKIIFWNVVSNTNNRVIDFVKDFDIINHKISKKIICCSAYYFFY